MVSSKNIGDLFYDDSSFSLYIYIFRNVINRCVLSTPRSKTICCKHASQINILLRAWISRALARPLPHRGMIESWKSSQGETDFDYNWVDGKINLFINIPFSNIYITKQITTKCIRPKNLKKHTDMTIWWIITQMMTTWNGQPLQIREKISKQY